MSSNMPSNRQGRPHRALNQTATIDSPGPNRGGRWTSRIAVVVDDIVEGFEDAVRRVVFTTIRLGRMSWARLSEQLFRVDKCSVSEIRLPCGGTVG